VIRELDKLSPDPARRTSALARIVGASRRLAQGPATLESERGISRESSAGRHHTPPVAQTATQQGPRSAGSRLLESPKQPWPAGSELPKTARSPTSSPGQAGATAPPTDPPASRRGALLRPFPPRFAGRFQVRGPVLRSVDKVVTDIFGAAARDDVVARMPDGYAAEFRNGSINALVAYELEALDAYMETATAMLVRDPGRWRDFGRLAVDGELYNVVRTLLRPAVDAGGVVRRGVSTWARLFSFGAWRVGTAPSGRVTLTIGELDAVAQPLRLWVVGVIEQTARRAVRGDLRVIITSGEQEFAPEMSCEIG
jgi:serine/threonine-protein kinase